MKDVDITLKSRITVQNDTQEDTYEYKGRFERKNGKNYIMYEDENKTSNVIKSDGDTVIVSRNGTLKSIMRVCVGKDSDFLYTTPQGSFDLTVSGKTVSDCLLVANSLCFEYELKTKFGIVSTNRIEIILKEV